MTDPSELWRSVKEEDGVEIAYISGPMRGYEEFNFPAFDDAEAALKDLGWVIFSPAQMDRDAGEDAKDVIFSEAIRRDIRAITECTAMVMLPGWEQSVGANIEKYVGEKIELRFYLYEPVNRVVIPWNPKAWNTMLAGEV